MPKTLRFNGIAMGAFNCMERNSRNNLSTTTCGNATVYIRTVMESQHVRIIQQYYMIHQFYIKCAMNHKKHAQ